MALRALHDLPAPAKLNLFLHVVGRRPDGYHLLQSVFLLIDWCDTLHVELRTDGQLLRHDLGAELPADDLCLRAARALQLASGSTLGADVSIDKRVPWGAGLGGGSSDAATTLLALNRLWGLDWPRSRLMPIAESLGADVPFFVGGRNALVEGIGEQLTPVDLAPAGFAVVKPAATIATRDIFTSPALVRNSEPAIISGFLADTHALLIKGGLNENFRNDLQPVAESVCSDVALVSRWLETRFGNSRMSGSGSAVFAVMSARNLNAKNVTPDPATFNPQDLPAGWEGRMCRSLPQHPLVGWAD